MRGLPLGNCSVGARLGHRSMVIVSLEHRAVILPIEQLPHLSQEEDVGRGVQG